AGFMPARVIHLHPSRFCNLACNHCYSSSGPGERLALDPDSILSALRILRGEGYDVLSLAGGEPLLYGGFEAVVRGAVDLGFRVNLISNGAAVGGRLLELIAEHVSLIAISLDGGPALHAEVRGDPRAFSWAERACDRLRDKGVHFGLAYCVSRESLADMPWAVEFAERTSAALVQFHPFAATGRGQRLAERLSLDEADKARAYVIAALLEADGGPAIQLDLVPVDAAGQRRADYRILNLVDARNERLAELVNPLVIDERARLLPLSYGIASRLAIGRLGPGLEASLECYKTQGWHDLAFVLDTAFTQLGAHGERFVDWFYHVVETSRVLAEVPTA
ncbi:MAG: radical SAM protein, partial [Chloroflexota bacterium]|nr:radical SAM protein [Chloroflexota bacterium]